jgi:hypothetical protein
MTKVPSNLRRQVLEGTGLPDMVQNELLLCLIDTLAAHNAILDDTIHHELHAMKQSMAEIANVAKGTTP